MMSNLRMFILQYKNPVEVFDVVMWHNWIMNNKNTCVQSTSLLEGAILIYTQFLACEPFFNFIDQTLVHNSIVPDEELDAYQSYNGPPIFFESRVFGGSLGGARDMYASWEEAALGHRRLVSLVYSAITSWDTSLNVLKAKQP